MTSHNRRFVHSFLTLAAAFALVGFAIFVPAAAASVTDPHWRLSITAPDDVPAEGPFGSGPVKIFGTVENVGDVPLSGSLTLTHVFPAELEPVNPETAPSASCELVGQTSTCTFNVDGAVPGSLIRFWYDTSVVGSPSGTMVSLITASGGGMATESTSQQEMTIGAPGPFEIKRFGVDLSDDDLGPATRAGSAPREITTALAFRSAMSPIFRTIAPSEHFKDTIAHLPAGFVGNPTASASKCTSAQLVSRDPTSGRSHTTNCPQDSQVGLVRIRSYFGLLESLGATYLPLYNMEPPPGVPAQFGFIFSGITSFLNAKLQPQDYSIDLVARDVVSTIPIPALEVTFWGTPADHSHDFLRHLCMDGMAGNWMGESCPSAAPRTPFLRMPTSCSETPLRWGLEVDTYTNPGVFHRAQTTTAATGECEKTPFDPSFFLQPTDSRPHGPSGVDMTLELPQDFGPKGLATADLRTAEVTLPEGMALNPSSAGGLEACDDSDLRLGLAAVATCPDGSKLGTVRLETPLLDHPVGGSIFLRPPVPGAAGSGLYRVAFEIRSDDDGVDIKLPGEIRADAATGQLRATFDNLPQLPFSSLNAHFKSGQRAPLVLPRACGTHSVETRLTGWNGTVVERTSTFTVSGDGAAGACPNPGFNPNLSAGVQNPIAGDHSPFVLQLKRDDSDQELRSLDVTLPPGLSGKLAGIPPCPEEAIAAAMGMTAVGQGAGGLASPACPAVSQVGTVLVGAGAGDSPFYLDTGRAYLAGPYKGAPLSLAFLVPALAGPFDLGNVVVRAAVHVDPTSGQITTKSDPLPTILHGIPLDLREVRLNLDRPGFMLNPTNCKPMSIDAAVSSTVGANAHPSERFQVADCGALGFKPKLGLRLQGGTRRSDFPALRAVLTMPKRGANIARASVALPRSEFLAQSHIGTICTRVQFAADACPKASVYGRARAFTALLDQPLEGPVYLRSNGGDRELPDLVADLRGRIDIELVGYIDSVDGGLRTTFAKVPDAPVSKFVLNMAGGRKGLLENHTDLCAARHRATVKMDAQNGRFRDFRPVLRVKCGKRKK
jgi:hypothetical protein